jgi:hypothetical protein
MFAADEMIGPRGWSYDELIEACLSSFAEPYPDYLGLWQVTGLLRDAGIENVDERRAVAVRLVRDLVLHHGLVPGSLADGGGFDPWPLPSVDAVARIEREWTAMPGDPGINDICWLDRPD